MYNNANIVIYKIYYGTHKFKKSKMEELNVTRLKMAGNFKQPQNYSLTHVLPKETYQF